MIPTVEPWLTKRQIATHLAVSVRTVERLRLPCQRVGGQNRYRVSEVDAFLTGRDPDGKVVRLWRKGAA